jgi:hypothetical protein
VQSNSISNFFGKDGTIFAIGIVEDRNDPLMTGRCKVRYFGYDTKDKMDIPTELLPWSSPITSLDSGRNVLGPKEGDWVFGFFLDGKTAQHPVILGLLTGIPEIPGNPKEGFNDPRPASQAALYPQNPLIPPSGKGSIYPLADRLKISDAPLYEAGEIPRTLNEIKLMDIDVSTAYGHIASNVGSDSDDTENELIEEPPTPFAAAYPYNHAYESESGHVVELDDTPGCERIHIAHRNIDNGVTFEEIHPDAKRVIKTTNEKYEIVKNVSNVHILASEYKKVDSFKKTNVKADYDITVSGGDLNITVNTGKVNINVKDDMNLNVEKNLNVRIGGDVIAQVDGNFKLLVQKTFKLDVWMDTTINCFLTFAHMVAGLCTERIYGRKVSEVYGQELKTIYGDMDSRIGGSSISYILGNEGKVVGGSSLWTVIGSIEIQTAVMNILSTISTTIQSVGTILMDSIAGIYNYSVGPIVNVTMTNLFNLATMKIQNVALVEYDILTPLFKVPNITLETPDPIPPLLIPDNIDIPSFPNLPVINIYPPLVKITPYWFPKALTNPDT